MELHPGVYTSNVSTDEWEKDPEVCCEFHALCDADGVQAGLSRMTQAPEKPVPFKSEMRETIIVLEGAVRIVLGHGAGDLGCEQS